MPRPQHRQVRSRRRRLVIGLSALVTAVVVAAVAVLALGVVHRAPAGRVARPPVPARRTPVPLPAPATYPTADGVGASWVAAENRRPGTSAWTITGPQTPAGMMGYADQVDATMGQTVTLRVLTTAPTFRVEAYRMGYYQGHGARLVWRSPETPATPQPPCPVSPGVNMVECQWQPSLRLTITSAWVQGDYLLKLVGSGGQQSYVPLTVWDPASHAAYVIMSGPLTDEVFNPFGGYDLYQGATPCAPDHYPCSTRSRIVSFDRPYDFNQGHGSGSFLDLVYPLVRFAEEQGLDVTYWSDLTLAEHGGLLINHRMLISPGHDEEWSESMRTSTGVALDHGVNLAFMGASAVLRKVRLQPSPLGTDREIVNYRDPTADPEYGVDNAQVSQNDWGQPPASMPSTELVGASYIGYDQTSVKPLVVADPSAWLFAGTHLAAGASIPGAVAGDIQSYDPSDPSDPPGVQILAHSPVQLVGRSAPHFADTTYYTTAGSHAGVFDSGSIGWIPSLADCPPSTPSCPAPLMRALTANLFRVMGGGPSGITNPSIPNSTQIYH